jgi:hypothetical protein
MTKQIFFSHRFGPNLSDFVFLNYAEHRRLYYFMSSGGIFCHFCIRVFNLRSCDLRLTLGRAPLCSLILVCVSQFTMAECYWSEESSLPFVGHH